MEKQTIEMNILSNKNAVPYMIIDSIKLDRNKIETTEQLQVKDENRLPKELVDSRNNKQTKKLNVGTIICKFLNNYDSIIKIFDKCKEILVKNIDYEECDHIFGLLRDNLEKYPIIRIMLIHIIDSFEFDILYNKPITRQKIQNEIYTAENFWKIDLDNIPQHQSYYDNLRKQLSIIQSPQYFTDLKIKFFQDIINEMEVIKNLIDGAFATTSKDTKRNLFTHKNIKLPRVKIEYLTANNNFVTRYTYAIKSLSDFFNVSLYHIVLTDKAIIKCPACGTYFIPNNKNEKYCYGKYRKVNCKGRQVIFEKKAYVADDYFHRICNRLRKERYPNEKDMLQTEYDKFKKSLLIKASNREKIEHKLVSFLIEYDFHLMKKYNKKWNLYKKYEYLIIN